MLQKTLDGRVEVTNKAERTREIAAELGTCTVERIYRETIRRGIFSADDREAAQAEGLKRRIKRYLKEDDEKGLPEFGPTQKTQEGVELWTQRKLWKLDDYRVYVSMLGEKEAELHKKRSLAIAECCERYDVDLST